MKKKQKKNFFLKKIKDILFKNNKRIFWIILACFLVIVILGFIKLGFKIRLLTSDELQVQIRPLQSVINTQNNVPVELEFRITNKNFRSCHTSCNLVLTSAYSNQILNNKTIELSSNQDYDVEYLLSLNAKGKGQRIYYFEAFCHNIDTLWCETQEKEKYRSSLITINYNYSDSEQEDYEKIKEIQPNLYFDLNVLNKQEDKLQTYISQINKSIDYIKKYNFTSDILFEKYNKAIEKYYSQDFEDSLELLDQITVINYKDEILKLENSVEKFNNNTKILFLMNDSNYDFAFDYYMKTNKQKALEIKKIFKEVSNKKINEFYDLAEYDNLFYMFDKLNNLTLNYTQEKNQTESEIKKSIDYNYKKLRNLTLFNITNKLCEDVILLKKNFIDVNQTNFSFNTSYYDVLNDGYCSETYFLNYSIDYFETINLSYTEMDILVIGLDEPQSKCCVFEKCSDCEIEDDENYPIIFIHGHSFNKNNPPESSIEAFSKIQQKLSKDNLAINAGDIDYTSSNLGYWSLMEPMLSVRATYYYIPYYETDILATNIRKEEGIESYSIRLKELIDIVLEKTGKKKVKIVAHSMGGLVTRNYLYLFGEQNVDKILLIGTPNNGISGRVENLCGYFGDKKACNDMDQDSVFLKRLERYIPSIPVYTIIGKGCDTDNYDGDGVVTAESSYLEYANTSYIVGKCTNFPGTELHTDLLNPDKYPEVYEKIVEIMID